MATNDDLINTSLTPKEDSTVPTTGSQSKNQTGNSSTKNEGNSRIQQLEEQVRVLSELVQGMQQQQQQPVQFMPSIPYPSVNNPWMPSQTFTPYPPINIPYAPVASMVQQPYPYPYPYTHPIVPQTGKRKNCDSQELEQQSKLSSKRIKKEAKTRKRKEYRKPLWCSECKARHFGLCTQQTCRCLLCGQLGHKAKDCEFPKDVCWNCHNEGHWSKNCNLPRQSQLGHGSEVKVDGGSSSSAREQRKNYPSSEEEEEALCASMTETNISDNVNTGMYC